ncbi:MAG TPA: DNA polymerase I, partial [Phycisphaerae bacterium]|nr:DNA polymerase I [Phycisphaerae bacterium]
GRRRRVGDVDARNPQQRAMARRLAINTVVQGSAADLIKRAMIDIADRIATENRKARMLLQIHDELLFEIPPESLDADRQMIEEGMSGAIKMRVPLKVDINTGATWMEAK